MGGLHTLYIGGSCVPGNNHSSSGRAVNLVLDTIQLELSSLDTLPMCKLVMSHTPDSIHSIMSETRHMQMYMPSYLLEVFVKALAECPGRSQELCHRGSTPLVQNGLQRPVREG